MPKEKTRYEKIEVLLKRKLIPQALYESHPIIAERMVGLKRDPASRMERLEVLRYTLNGEYKKTLSGIK